MDKEYSGNIIYPYTEDDTVYETVKVTLDPSPREIAMLFGAAGATRFSYNWVISKFKDVQSLKNETYKNGEDSKVIPFKVDGKEDNPYLSNEYGMRKLWNQEKPLIAPWYKTYSKECYATGVRRACLAIRDWIKSLSTDNPRKEPRFHKRTDLIQSFEITTGTFGLDKDNRKNIIIPKIGKIHTFENVYKRVGDRPVQKMTIKYDGLRWTASLLVKGTRNCRPKTPKKYREAVGIDLGCKELVVGSDGTIYSHKRFDKKNESKYKHLQRSIARKEKSSKSRDKAKKKLRKVSKRISNQREDYLHKVSNEICLNYETICLENLNVQGMSTKGGSRKTGLNRSILDASLSRLRSLIEQKSKVFGNTVVIIDQFYPSTQICSNCKEYPKTKVTLEDRTYYCENCGLTIDRDFNASLNILDEGLRILDIEERRVPTGLPVEDHTSLSEDRDSEKLEPSNEFSSYKTWSYAEQLAYSSKLFISS